MTGLAKSWGPYAWYLFHILSLTWNKKNIKFYNNFFELIRDTIPCYICSTNFKKKLNYKEYNIYKNCSSKLRMIEWLINMHNMINKSNGKKIYSINDVLKLHIKNKSITVNSKNISKFIQEYIYYNIKIGKKKKAIKLLYILAIIYPDPKKKVRVIYFIKNHRSKNILQFLNGYIRAIS
tara:strand:- start:2712 stop:3248 length:537 start_codon:yes stop_codon:yes gene_type:complete